MQVLSIRNDTGRNVILDMEPEGDEFELESSSSALIRTSLSDVQKQIDISIDMRDDRVVVAIWSVEEISVAIDGKMVLEA